MKPNIQKNQRQRESRRIKDGKKSRDEQRQMEKQSRRVSIGVFNIFKPKPSDSVSSFTLALPKSIPKSQLYPLLKEAFDGHWDGEPTKSVFVRLSEPLPLCELRKRVRDSIEKLI